MNNEVWLFTAVFYVGGSILPCIAAHIAVNATGIFAVEPDLGGRIALAAAQSVVSVVCGVWILRRGKAKKRTVRKKTALRGSLFIGYFR